MRRRSGAADRAPSTCRSRRARDGRAIAVASGGRDSTALLHCTVRLRAALGHRGVALHVHHGLVADADDWLRAVARASAGAGGVGLATAPAGRTSPPRGASVEAWARRERYRALAEMARAAGCAAGAAGAPPARPGRDLAAAGAARRRAGGAGGDAARGAARRHLVWARPWLGQPREAIEAYLRRHRLRHVDDASNDDPRYARNRLRSQVWPALPAAFRRRRDGAGRRRSARRSRRRALADRGRCGRPAGGRRRQTRCDVAPRGWRCRRRAGATRCAPGWQRVADGGVPQSLIERLMRRTATARGARWPAPGGRAAAAPRRLSLQRRAAADRARRTAGRRWRNDDHRPEPARPASASTAGAAASQSSPPTAAARRSPRCAAVTVARAQRRRTFPAGAAAHASAA